MKKIMLTLLFLLPFAFTSAMAVADNDKAKGKGHQNSAHSNSGQKQNGKGNSNGSKSGKHSDDELNVTLTFSQARGLAVSQGLTGYSALPPGVAKNLARGKPLPPGIAKKAVPAGLRNSLPRYPGYEWYIAGDDLILVAVTTAVVNTVLPGVFN